MFETIVPLAMLVFPIIIFCLFWDQVHKFDNERGNKKYRSILYEKFAKDVFPNKSLEQVEKKLKERYVPDRKINKLLKNYKVLRRWIIISVSNRCLFGSYCGRNCAHNSFYAIKNF